MNFNDDKNGLIEEEQKILVNLIEQMDFEIEELDARTKRFILEAKKALESGNNDERTRFLESKHNAQNFESTKDELYQSKDELYNTRIIVKTEIERNGYTKSGIREIKIGLHSCHVGAKNFITDWRMDVCRHYLLDNCSLGYDFELNDKTNTCKTHYTLLFKNKIKFRFAEVKDTVNMYPAMCDEELINNLLGTGALSDEYLLSLLNSKQGKIDTDESIGNLIYDEFLRELAERRANTEFQNIVFSIQKKQGEIIQTPFNKNIIVQGCAGSGKSMIMFHRLPILIYDNPNTLNRKNLYIITPSKAYIQLSDDMRHQLEIEDLKMGTLKDYYDYCIKKYGIKQENVYGKIHPYRLIKNEDENYVYSESCINDILLCLKRGVPSFDVSLKKAYEMLNMKYDVQSKNTIYLNFNATIIAEQKVIDENKRVLKDCFYLILDFVNILKDFCTALVQRKSKINSWLLKELSEINKAMIGAKEKLDEINIETNPDEYDRNLIEVRNIDEKFTQLMKESQKVRADTEYFLELESLNALIMEELNCFDNMKNEFEKNSLQYIYDCIENKERLLESCELLLPDIFQLCSKYSECDMSINLKVEKISKMMTRIKNLQFNYLPIETYLQLVDHSDALKKFVGNAVNETYIHIMDKIGVAQNKKGKIEAVECSPYIYLQILFQYYGVPNVQKETLITIDEAQNIASTELKLIHSVNNGQTIINLFGDEKQHIEGSKGINSWSEFGDIVNFERFDMQENYRNASQITEYCNKVFDMNMQAINTSGNGVHEIIDYNGLKSILIRQLLSEQKVGLAAIIVKNTFEAQWLLDEFSEYQDKFCDLTRDEFDLHPTKWNIVTAEESRGLEFHTVFVLSYNMTENEKYIAYTRALDELFVYEEKIDIEKYKEILSLDDDNSSEIVSEKKKKNLKSNVLKINQIKKKEKPIHNEVKEYFENMGLKVVDDRMNGGKLWVLGGRDKIENYINKAVDAFDITGKYASCDELKIKFGWCTKTRK